MRIGIDCRTILSPALGEKAGVGHYTYYLVKYLLKADQRNQYVLFFDHRVASTQEFKRKNVKIVRFPYSEYKRYLPFAYSHLFVSQILNRERLDLFHAPANVVPLQYKRPCVVTVHDLAIYQHPEWFPNKQDFSIKILVPKSLHKAKQIIAVSQSTANDVHRQFGIEHQRINVVYEGHEPNPVPKKLAARQIIKKFHLSEDFFLYIGTLEPRKNIAGLIAAFDTLVSKRPRRFKNVQLVLAGAKGFRFEDNYLAIQTVKAGSVRYLGYVTPKEKLALLALTKAFVFPSLYEGFGLPVVEAMACGTPVITSRVSSLPEVVGKAALLINPNKPQTLMKAIDQCLNQNTRKRYGRLGKQQAKQFTWQRCVEQTLAVYEKALH
ncbi:MAG: glycosyl transferase group 1 [uncultured bacterium]|nr:MAG: glycosyl transferase group 1 [uncultured bacterium]